MNQTPNIRREPQLPLPLASQSLTFNGVVLMPLSLGGQLWFRSSELARALGYKDENSVRRIYERNADEFTDDMTQVIEILDTVNLTVRVRPIVRNRSVCAVPHMLAAQPKKCSD